MTGDQHLIRRGSGEKALSVTQVTILQRGVNTYLILALPKCHHLIVGKAKSPVLVIVGRTVRNPVRMFRQRKKMRLEFIKRHNCTHRNTVVQDVQVTFAEVNHALAVRALNIGVPDVPFLRYYPVENRCAARHLEDSQWNPLLDRCQGPPESVPGNAPADWIQLSGKTVQFRSDFYQILGIEFHSHASRSLFEIRVGSVSL